MKICFLSAVDSIHIIRWANAMSERGHNITVISCANSDATVNKLNKEVKVHFLKYPTGCGYYLNASQLKHIVKKEKFDVVNVHYASGYGTLARRAKLKNALLNIWGSDVYEFPYQSGLKMRIIKKNLRYFKYAASTSCCMARQAKKLVDRDYFITPFGVDTELFKPMPQYKPKDKIIFGTVKALLPIYGIIDTILAFIKLNERLGLEGRKDISDRLFYEIYGNGEQWDELQNLIDESNMSKKIKLCGYIPNKQLSEIYNRFTIFNCNSVSESFGVAAVEAMACGIPVQTSDADGFVEVVESGVTGLIAPKRNVEAIAENMYELLMNEDLRIKMGAAGVERVKKLYNWEDNVKTMEQIYNTIMVSN